MLQTDFKSTPHGLEVGELVKKQEPNDTEAIMAGENDIGVGIFVKKVLEGSSEVIKKLEVTDTDATHLFGITVNAVSTSNTTKNSYVYHKGVTTMVGRISSKLSIRPKILKADGLNDSDVLTAALYVVAGGTNTGALYISTVAPTPTEEVKYITLSASKYKLRPDTRTGEIYLEVIGG